MKEKLNTNNMKPTVLTQEFKITYSQDNDCTDDNDTGQFLTIRTDNGGDEDFFIIETERWSIDNIDDLIETLEDFKTKYNKLKN